MTGLNPTTNAEAQSATAALVRANDSWRQWYNPLRGLAISTVVTWLEAAQRGDFLYAQLYYDWMERRFPILRSCIARRAAALGELDWDIKIVSELPPGATEAQAEAQRLFLRSRYELIENLREAIEFLALAEFRGFSILAKHRIPNGAHDGAVRELHWLPQWKIIRDGRFGAWYWNPDAKAISTLSPDLAPAHSRTPIAASRFAALGLMTIDPADVVIREVSRPANEIAAIYFPRHEMGWKDWSAFVESYGIPAPIIEMPPSIPAGREPEYLASARSIASGAPGTIPPGAKPHFPTAAVRTNSPFEVFLKANKEDVVLAATGGLLTMLNEPTGIGGGPSEEHADAFSQLARSEARTISEIFQRQFDQAELAQEFPGQPRLAYFELAAADEEDLNELTDRVQKLESSGLNTDPEEISEKLNLKLVRGGAGVPPNAADQGKRRSQIANRQSASVPRGDLVSAAQPDYYRAVAADLQPIRRRLERIAQIADPDIRRERLIALRADLPGLLRDINADPEAAGPLEQTMAAALLNGISQAPDPADPPANIEENAS